MCKVLPLREPKICGAPSHGPAKRYAVGVGDAVDPDGSASHQSCDPQRKAARRGTCCNDDVGAFSQHDPDDDDQAPDCAKPLIAVCVGNGVEAMARHVAGERSIDAGEHKIMRRKRRPKAEQLNPVTAT